VIAPHQELLDGFTFCGSTVQMLPKNAPLPSCKTFEPRAFTTRWALKKASLLDGYCPGFLNHLLFTSDGKRQAVFAALAALDSLGPASLARRMRMIAPAECLTALDPFAQIGRALIVSKPRGILEAVFGSLPHGLLGIIARIGHQPFGVPAKYALLHELFSSPMHRARAKVLRETGGTVDATAIQVVRELDDPWLRVEVVQRLRSLEELRLFQDVVFVLRYLRPDLSDTDLARSFEHLGARTDLNTWASRLIEGATRFPPAPPIADDGEFRCLRSGADMQEAARQFHNCLASKIPEVALGRVAFVLYVPGPALIELVRLTDGRNDNWALDAVHADGHANVSPEAVRAIRSKLTQAGVLIPSRFNEPRPVRSVAHLLGMFDLDCWALGDRKASGPSATIEHEQFA
jgi:hypothetical protein